MTVESPCTAVCKVDPATGLCMGCFRTLDEIAGWKDAGVDEKEAILARARVRLGGEGETKQCAHCRTPFSCGAAGGRCWCMELPAVTPVAGGGCLCPICLSTRASGRGNPPAR